MKGFRLIVLMSLLLMVGGAGSAFADEPEAPSGPTYDGYLKAINSDTSGSNDSQLTDPEAASQLPHRDLARDEALALIKAVFGPVLQEPAGPFDELEVTKFLSDNVAVVAADDQPEELASKNQESVLLDSTVPLRTEDSNGNRDAVDLSLEQANGELQPANPLVDVGIPNDLGEGMAFPGAGVRITPASVPEDRSPSTIDQSVAFYPNVARDTDLAIATTLGGVETLTQLRSKDAPQTQSFEVELPANATLGEAENGGATVKADGETILSISPPSAMDASGKSVPSSLEVGGDSITLRVSPPADVQYPILLDPVIDEYVWGPANVTAGLNDWKSTTTISTYTPTTWANCGTSCYSGLPWGWPGLYIGGAVGGGSWPGATAEWSYFIPRWQTEWNQNNHSPTTFIDSTYYWSVGYWHRADANLSPYLVMGIWRPMSNSWVSSETWAPNKGDLNEVTGFNFHAATQDYEGKEAIFALTSTDAHGLTSYRDAYLGYAQVALGDPDNPKFATIGSAPQWVNKQPTSAIPFTVSDAGLGVYSITVSDQQSPAHSWQTLAGCSGGAGNPCPLTWKSTDAGRPAVSYDPSVLPQGTNTLKVTASDPIGHYFSANTQVKVDHTAPTIALSGTMTEQTKLGKTRPQYVLKAISSDGTEASPQSGVASTEITIDGKKVDSTSAGCETKNCPVTREWTLNSLGYSVGKHVVVVKATDSVGISSETSLTIEIQRDTTAPQITSLTGDLITAPEGWVEQKSYGMSTQATDSGFGVTSLVFKIDGKSVKTSTKTCGGGGCESSMAATINMATYKGGEHSAELIATDGAGNSAAKSWTVNVDPEGTVSAGEAIQTLEAVDDTAETETTLPTSAVVDPAEMKEGNNPSLSGLESEGTAVPTVIATDPKNGFTITNSEEEEIRVSPTSVDPSATSVGTVGGVSAVIGNTGTRVDSVLRPIYDGLMVFQAIRYKLSPENFQWEVQLSSGQTMSESNGTVEVYYEDGTPAMMIDPGPARDATGKAVPTSLTASGKIITLNVAHRKAGFVYPVVAGPSFQTGYVKAEVYNPPPPPPNEQTELEASVKNSVLYETVSAPVPVGNGDDYDVSASSVPTYRKGYAFGMCEEHSWPIPGCSIWAQEIGGFFYYNNRYAWWKSEQVHPQCPHNVGPGYAIALNYCDFSGPNHQKYGGGYHITSQVFFDVSVAFQGGPLSWSHAMTVRMFGSGGVYVHKDETCVCNPST